MKRKPRPQSAPRPVSGANPAPTPPIGDASGSSLSRFGPLFRWRGPLSPLLRGGDWKKDNLIRFSLILLKNYKW